MFGFQSAQNGSFLGLAWLLPSRPDDAGTTTATACARWHQPPEPNRLLCVSPSRPALVAPSFLVCAAYLSHSQADKDGDSSRGQGEQKKERGFFFSYKNTIMAPRTRMRLLVLAHRAKAKARSLCTKPPIAIMRSVVPSNPWVDLGGLSTTARTANACTCLCLALGG